MAKRVLVVSSQEGFAPVLQMQIELWGGILDFTLAASANEALWEVRGSPYELVLAPWQLPEMTGIEFAEVVQALSPASRLILIGAPVTPALQSQAEGLNVVALLGEVSPQEVAIVMSRTLDLPLPPAAATSQAESMVQSEPVAQPSDALLPGDVGTAAAGPGVVTALPTEFSPLPVLPEEPVAAAQWEVAQVSEPGELEPIELEPVQLETAPPEPAGPTVVLTALQEEDVRQALRELLASVGPQAVVLVGGVGDPLVVEGAVQGLPLRSLSERAVSALENVDAMAQLLQDENLRGFALFVGSRFDVYAFAVTEATLLLMIFDKTVVEGKLGSVWLFTRRVVEELQRVLS